MHPLLETRREQSPALARLRGATSVQVFGSVRRGDDSADSGVDLLVTLAPGISALALEWC